MSKGASKPVAADLSKYCKSTFTLTFALEILGIEDWENCNEGWLNLGPYVQGMKLQYQIYPGQAYDVDIMIWPHAAKIWCGPQYGWVRTWQFLERRWLTFSIRHVFPVRVVDLQTHVATVTPSTGVGSLGANAKNDKNFEVFLPPLGFGVRRYFATVLESEESLAQFVQNLIWSAVEEYIPWSYLDGVFDTPQPVSDLRHQDASIDCVRDTILKWSMPEEIEEAPPEVEESRSKYIRRESKMVKEKEKKKVVEVQKAKFEIKLSGESILAGTGRIVQFENSGERPPDLGEIIVLISSNNLPAQDDLPIVFVNVENLAQIPINELKILRITQLYTKWRIGDVEYSSEPQPLKSKPTIDFNTHRAIPIPYDIATNITSDFLDISYAVELRGIRLPPMANANSKLFGYEKSDREFSTHVPKPANNSTDILIAVTKIDASRLAKGVSAFVRGEYPLFPPRVSVQSLDREGYCTNDINSIRAPVKPNLIVKPDIILQAQMTLEVSIGLVGCKVRKLHPSYSRMFCLVKGSNTISNILRQITNINEEIIGTEKKEDLLTGFALDTGDMIVLYLEGPKDGNILRIWEMTEDFYPDVKPLFSCSARYSTRIYPEFILAALPFITLKMFVPLGVLLACPPVYARPALPLPTRSAVLKLGRLTSNTLKSFPSRFQMPTAAELKSFRLELCVAPRPAPVVKPDVNISKLDSIKGRRENPLPSVTRINWDM